MDKKDYKEYLSEVDSHIQNRCDRLKREMRLLIVISIISLFVLGFSFTIYELLSKDDYPHKANKITDIEHIKQPNIPKTKDNASYRDSLKQEISEQFKRAFK